MKVLKIILCVLLAIASGIKVEGGPTTPFYIISPLAIIIAILIGLNRWPKLHVHLIWMLVTLVSTQLMYQQYAYEKACVNDYRWDLEHAAQVKALSEHHQ